MISKTLSIMLNSYLANPYTSSNIGQYHHTFFLLKIFNYISWMILMMYLSIMNICSPKLIHFLIEIQPIETISNYLQTNLLMKSLKNNIRFNTNIDQLEFNQFLNKVGLIPYNTIFGFEFFYDISYSKELSSTIKFQFGTQLNFITIYLLLKPKRVYILKKWTTKSIVIQSYPQGTSGFTQKHDTNSLWFSYC